MLQQLHIQNYAIIDSIEINFSRHLNIITGETGAGKSILMGALNLILGERADTSVLLDKEKKCFVEGIFNTAHKLVTKFLQDNELDCNKEIVIRREISVSGKSRAFINDTEQHTVQRILTLLTPLVGAHNVRAQASADIDFSQHEQTSEVYRPNQKPGDAAVRSEQTNSSLRNNVVSPEGVPGALTNQPPANATAPITIPRPPLASANPPAGGVAPAASGAQTKAPSDSRHDATINYEVDRTINHVKDPTGKVRRLSVAVVLNYQPDASGKLAPLDSAELTKISGLVKQAMGYSEARGDTLSVVNSPFTTEQVEKTQVWENPRYVSAALQLGQYLLIALVILVLWRSLLKPLVIAMIASKPANAGASSSNTSAQNEAAAAQRASEIGRYDDNLDTARRMAEKDPRAVAMVMRTWMANNGSN